MKGFYVQLDATHDLRLATINQLDPTRVEEAIGQNYHVRRGDFFNGVDPEEYQRVYKAKEMELLTTSYITNIFEFLLMEIATFMREAVTVSESQFDLPVLDVNTWPFSLSSEEASILRALVYARLGGEVGVNVINIDPKRLTPAKCSLRYYFMVMYDYDDYINMHSDALISAPVPSLILVAPMVFFNKDPETDPDIIEELNRGINPLSLLETSIAPRIGLRFIDIEYFSIIYPDSRLTDRLLETREKDPADKPSNDGLSEE